MAESVKVFLSTVSDEFRAYRDQLRSDLTRHNVEVKVQEDFKDLGGDTLDKLDVYIAHCDCVVHLVGDMTGSAPLQARRRRAAARQISRSRRRIAAARRGAARRRRRLLHAMGGVARALSSQAAVDRQGRRHGRARDRTMRRRTPRARRKPRIWRGFEAVGRYAAADTSPAQTISPSRSPTASFLISWRKRAPNERRAARKTSPSPRSARSSRAASKSLIGCTKR